MSRVKFDSFESLSIELQQQADGLSKMIIKEERRVEIETTDSIMCNIMPCSFPNPEQVLLRMEESFARQWDNNPRTRRDKAKYVARMVGESIDQYVMRVSIETKHSFVARMMKKAYL
jgi:hypothetical protein